MAIVFPFAEIAFAQSSREDSNIIQTKGEGAGTVECDVIAFKGVDLALASY